MYPFPFYLFGKRRKTGWDDTIFFFFSLNHNRFPPKIVCHGNNKYTRHPIQYWEYLHASMRADYDATESERKI